MRKEKNGPSRYAVNVLLNIAKIDQQNRYTILVNKGYTDFIHQANFNILSTSVEPYRIKEHWAIRGLVKGEKFDLFHSFQYIPPIGLRYPMVMTIYDTMHMDKNFWKGSFYKNIAGKYVGLLARYSMKRAISIITISEYSAKQTEKTFHYPINKIFPIHLGVDKSYRNRNQSIDFQYSANKWNIPGPYLLTISNMRPYKNVDSLIFAFADLVKSGYDQHSLVLAGMASDLDMNSKRELADSLSLGNKIYFLKDLNDNDLKALLGGSSIFIFPSKEEGFGLPLLEAMAAGIPCIASKIDVFREICGDAPMYFDPDDITELKENILKLILSDKLRKELSIKGLQRSEIFSWENTARQTLAVYNNILIE